MSFIGGKPVATESTSFTEPTIGYAPRTVPSYNRSLKHKVIQKLTSKTTIIAVIALVSGILIGYFAIPHSKTATIETQPVAPVGSGERDDVRICAFFNMSTTAFLKRVSAGSAALIVEYEFDNLFENATIALVDDCTGNHTRTEQRAMASDDSCGTLFVGAHYRCLDKVSVDVPFDQL